MTQSNWRWARRVGMSGLLLASAALAVGSAPLAEARVRSAGTWAQAMQASDTGGWAGAAQNLRSHVGSRYVYTCPAGGPPRTAWGTDVYTDDSSVCTAAVHAGRITVAAGGPVTIEIRPGQASYAGSTRNGITTADNGVWGGSFVFVTGSAVTTPPPGQSGWSATGTRFRGKLGKRFVYACPARGAVRPVWGTDIYTDDSSVCTAAVHTRRLTVALGGSVTIEMRPGQRTYRASTRGGVASKTRGAFAGSFVIVSAAAATAAPTTTTTAPAAQVTTTTVAKAGPEEGGTGWGAAAQNLRNRVGTLFVYTCPAGGPARTAWGTDIYTDDSSVCTAAVHAGRITVAGGGKVVVEILPGQAAYTGSTRNGITTQDNPAWGGSLRFVG